MADNDEENGLITIATGTLPNVTDPLNPESVIVTHTGDVRVITEDDAEAILQQAIQDAQEFGEEAVTLSYVTEEGETDPMPIVVQEEVNMNNVVTNPETSLDLSVVGSSGEDGRSINSYDVSYAVVTDDGEMIQTDSMRLDDGIEGVMMASESQNQLETVTLQQVNSTDKINAMQSDDFAQTVHQGGLNVTLVPTNQNSVAPIGSSQNPIRIVQQGNQYTPVQQLTAEQLQQIMHVVQEQQLAKSADSNNGSSILYNPQTNTRIVYRVIYPSELHKTSGDSTPHCTTITIGSQTGSDNDISQIQRRVYKKRAREDEEDKVEGPEMSKEEKEERKKHRPRTRSGRVSKPPKHMVKDYKHIHVLDWDEDYDDSDGGYSDFKISDEDKTDRNINIIDNNSKDSGGSPEFNDGGVGIERVKNYKCYGCDKAYIGQGGLRRHYQLNPSHVNPSEECEKVATGTSGTGINNNNPSNGSICSLSEDSNTQDSLPSQGTPSTTGTPSLHKPQTRGRGRPAQSLDGAPGRRRAKLQDLVRQCTDDELMEIVLPRLANVITLWEFLMMKVEKGGKAIPKVGDIYGEFETLQKQVAKTCQDCLVPLGEMKETSDPTDHKFEIDNEVVAACLGLKVGQYQVKTMPPQDKSFHYKFLTTEPHGIPAKRQNNRRTIEIVTPDELVQSTYKKPRMTTLLTNSVVSMAAKVSHSTSATTSSSSSSLLSSSSSSSSNVSSVMSTVSSAPILLTSMPASATPMQIVVNNHNNLLSEPIQMPISNITSQVLSTVCNGSSSHGAKTQTVLLTNSAAPPIFGTLNGGNVLNINGNSLGSANNGTSLLNGNSVINNNIVSNTQLKIETQHPKEIMQISEMPNFVNTQEINRHAEDVKTNVNTKLIAVDDGICILDPGETRDLQLLNSIHDGALLIHEKTVKADEIIDTSTQEEEQVLSVDQIEGEIISPDQIVTSASNIFQTEDGILIIQNPDGTTFQLQGAEGIPLETVQALLAMESEGQFVEQEQIQTEMQ